MYMYMYKYIVTINYYHEIYIDIWVTLWLKNCAFNRIQPKHTNWLDLSEAKIKSDGVFWLYSIKCTLFFTTTSVGMSYYHVSYVSYFIYI